MRLTRLQRLIDKITEIKRKKITVIFLLFLLLLPITNYQLLITDVFAAIPKLINYQGKLTNASGQPITETVNITFRIYDVESGGSPLWTETYTGLTVDKGIFNVLLGGVTALNLAFDTQYYLGIQVGSDAEMTPRQRLASAAYAFKAQDSETIGGIGVSATPTANKILPLDANGKLPAIDGSQLTNLPLNIQVFTTSGTFIKPAGVTKVFVECVGGGGGGASCDGYQAPTAGGTTSFGTFCSASGGGPGMFNSLAIPSGGSGTNGDINITGQSGCIAGASYAGGPVYTAGAVGGNSMYGFGGAGGVHVGSYCSGAFGTGYGGGGGSSWSSGAFNSGGGGGGYCAKICTLTDNVSVTIGSSGFGGQSNGYGTGQGGAGSSGVCIVRY